MATDGGTVVPDGREVQQAGDPCIRYVDGEKLVQGKHAFVWKDLLQMRECTTCGVQRPFTNADRFKQ